MERALSAVPPVASIALLAVLCSVPAALTAQQPSTSRPARVQGVVVHEATFEPIQDAVVTLVGTDIETRTGPLGQFEIADAPEGTAWVRVTAPGLPGVREQVEVMEDGVVFLQFRMPENVSAVLDEVLVDVVSPSEARADAKTALDLLALKLPSITGTMSGDLGSHDAPLRLRGYSTLSQDGDPLIVVDDVAVSGDFPLETLSRIPASDVASIELLKGPSAAFRYPFAANGVILVRTRKR